MAFHTFFSFINDDIETKEMNLSSKCHRTELLIAWERLSDLHGFKHVNLEMNSAALVSVSRSSFGSMVLEPLFIQLLHRDWDSSKT
ncbi:hypothetical protein NC651_036658 [Populus alba x Populus x berolinensis]|nr:hypothetical protein NC651_036658 [Populus alba x Populus x berolinensis]